MYTEPVTTDPVTAGAARQVRRAMLTQSWLDLTFVHWAVDPDAVAPLLPAGTRPDQFGDTSYVGLVAFRMHRIEWLGLPGLPYLRSLPATNIRLYSLRPHGRLGRPRRPPRRGLPLAGSLSAGTGAGRTLGIPAALRLGQDGGAPRRRHADLHQPAPLARAPLGDEPADRPGRRAGSRAIRPGTLHDRTMGPACHLARSQAYLRPQRTPPLVPLPSAAHRS